MTELKKYVDEGGKVLFFPSASGTIDQYNAFLKTMGANEFQAWEVKERQVGSVNTEAFIYKDVFTRSAT
jgi:hypothetical protein